MADDFSSGNFGGRYYAQCYRRGDNGNFYADVVGYGVG